MGVRTLWIGLLGACTGGTPTGPTTPTGDAVTLPDVSLATFVAGVDNTFLPFPVGASFTTLADGEEGNERIEVTVTDEVKVVNGVTVVVVRDSAYIDDVLAEDTRDWYAQDTEGNVWYLGEDTCAYEDGACVDTGGSWEWGVGGALPGIAMRGDPAVDGEAYYQEFLEGEAEDYGEVVEVDVAVTVPAGSFTGCVVTADRSTLDPALDERKTYCPGVGNVKVDEGDVVEELESYTMP